MIKAFWVRRSVVPKAKADTPRIIDNTPNLALFRAIIMAVKQNTAVMKRKLPIGFSTAGYALQKRYPNNRLDQAKIAS